MSVRAPLERVTSIAPMPGPLRIVVLGAVAATLIAGCGSDDGTIPREDGEDLLATLEAVDSNTSQGNCPQAQAQAESFKGKVNELPASVDDEVKQGLQQAADQLVSLAANDCEPEEAATGPEGAVTTDATETEPTTTEETTTTPETTTEETTTEEEPEEPVEPETQELEEDPDLAPSGNQGQGGSGGVGSDGGIGPGARGGSG